MCARHACSPLEALLVDSAFDADVYPDEPMRRHTMYRIGGPLCEPEEADFRL